MVLPFALVVAVGCHLFLFQSVSTASCSSCLQHVQSSMSTASWINRSGHSTALSTMMPSSAPLLSGRSFIAGDSKVNVTMAQLLWDPGGIPVAGIDRPPAPLHASIGWMLPFDPVDRIGRPPILTVAHLSKPFAPTVMNPSMSTISSPLRHGCDQIWDPFSACRDGRLRRQWDPGIEDGIELSFCFDFDLPASHSNVVAVTMAQTNRSTIDASVGWQSLFHCSHPVLSRPTVPNIDT